MRKNNNNNNKNTQSTPPHPTHIHTDVVCIEERKPSSCLSQNPLLILAVCLQVTCRRGGTKMSEIAPQNVFCSLVSHLCSFSCPQSLLLFDSCHTIPVLFNNGAQQSLSVRVAEHAISGLKGLCSRTTTFSQLIRSVGVL